MATSEDIFGCHNREVGYYAAGILCIEAMDALHPVMHKTSPVVGESRYRIGIFKTSQNTYKVVSLGLWYVVQEWNKFV